jgi:hypothetical protein
MKKYLYYLAGLLLLSSCNNFPPPPPPPCGTPYDCIEITTSGITCCGNAREIIATNHNPNKYITAVFIEETFVGNENWIQTDILLQVILPNTSRVLGCNRDNACQYKRRYRFYKGCFEDDADCAVPMPQNPDITWKQPCLTSCGSISDTCLGIDFNLLNNGQKAAIRELWTNLLLQRNHTFTNNLMQLFMINPLNAQCADRVEEISGHEFSSYGSDCDIYVGFPETVTIPATGETFDKGWLKFPSVIKGSLTKTANMGQADFKVNEAEALWVTVETKPGSKTRDDVISNIYALKNEKKLVLSGKDFICITFYNIDAD